jgi:site-specific DNA-methyltransferase (adenine-specific)
MLSENDIVLSCGVIDRISKQGKQWTDLLSLYTYYYRHASRQHTTYIRKTNPDASKQLGWGICKFKAIKSKLEKLGLIENVARRDKKGIVVGWYVKINGVSDLSTSMLFIPLETPNKPIKIGRKKGVRYGSEFEGMEDMVGKVVHGDCLQVLPHLPEKSINLICTDLPYGVTTHPWDAVIPLQPMWEQFYRILAPNGVIALFSTQPFTSVLIASNIDRFKHTWVWDKTTGGSPLNVKCGPRKVHEDVCVFGHATGKITYNPQMVPREKPVIQIKAGQSHFGGRKTPDFEANYTHYYPVSIQTYSKRSEKDGWLHPSQKPLDFVKYLIRTYSNKGEVVLDPCCGSGTTGVACVLEERKFIMIESERKYVNIAQQRIDRHTKVIPSNSLS